MDPAYQAFLAASAGYDIGYGGGPPQAPPLPFLGMLGGPQSTMGRATSALAPMLSEQMRGMLNQFVIPFGANAADTYQAREYQIGQLRVQSQMADMDRVRTQDMMRGVLIAAGDNYTVKDGRRYLTGYGREEALGRMSGDTSQVLGFLSRMMPDTVDKLLLGSRQVAAGSIYEGARFVPSNQTGLTGQLDAGGITKGVMNEVFGTGPEMNLSKSYGMLGRPVGDAFSELVKRGFIGSDSDVNDPEQVGKNAGRELQKYLGAIKAVKEVFGDIGNPNAPMREIINGLQAITAGGLGTIDPSELRSMVTRFQTIAKETPLGYEGVQRASMRSNALAEQFGVHRQYMTNVMSSGGMREVASNSAYLASNYKPSLYAMDQAQFAGFQEVLRAAGGSSAYGNVTGAMIEMGKLSEQGTPMRAILDAMTARKTTFKLDGKDVRIAELSVADLERLSQQSGMAPGSFTASISNTTANMTNNAAVPGSANITQDAQNLSVDRQLATMGRMLAPGMEEKEFVDLVRKSREGATNPTELAQRIAGGMGLEDSQSKDFSSRFVTELNRQSEQLRAAGSPAGMFDTIAATNPNFQGKSRVIENQLREQNLLRNLLSNKNPGSIMMNMMQTILGANNEYGIDFSSPDALTQTILKTLGAISNDDMKQLYRDMNTTEAHMGAIGALPAGVLSNRVNDAKKMMEAGPTNAMNMGSNRGGPFHGIPGLVDRESRQAIGAVVGMPGVVHDDMVRTDKVLKAAGMSTQVTLDPKTTLNVVITERKMNPDGSISSSGRGVMSAPGTIPVAK